MILYHSRNLFFPTMIGPLPLHAKLGDGIALRSALRIIWEFSSATPCASQLCVKGGGGGSHRWEE